MEKSKISIENARLLLSLNDCNIKEIVMDNKVKSDYKLIGYVRSETNRKKKYCLVIRPNDKSPFHEMKSLECNCQAFYFRKNSEDGCKHIQKVLYLNSDVPYGELTPPDVELTPVGKDSLVEYRILNRLEIHSKIK